MGPHEELPLSVFATSFDYVVADADLTIISEHDSPEAASLGLVNFQSASQDSQAAAIYHRKKHYWEVF